MRASSAIDEGVRRDQEKEGRWPLREDSGPQPPRKLGPQTYGHKELDSAKDLDECERFFPRASRQDLNFADILISALSDPVKFRLLI